METHSESAKNTWVVLAGYLPLHPGNIARALTATHHNSCNSTEEVRLISILEPS